MSEQVPTSEQWVEQSMHSSVAASHSIRAILVGLTCLVLGLYGIYDHQWAIPAEERAFERGELSRNVLASLDAIEAREDTQLIPATLETLDLSIARSNVSDTTDQETIEWQAAARDLPGWDRSPLQCLADRLAFLARSGQGADRHDAWNLW